MLAILYSSLQMILQLHVISPVFAVLWSMNCWQLKRNKPHTVICYVKKRKACKPFLVKYKWLLLVFVFFGGLFASISFVNHYNFRTYGWDLGINQNALFDYAHFKWNDCMIMQPSFDNVLADHFSLYPLLISPLYWVFGSYTMLIFQWAGILFGGLGVYRFVRFISNNKKLATFAVVHFFCFSTKCKSKYLMT